MAKTSVLIRYTWTACHVRDSRLDSKVRTAATAGSDFQISIRRERGCQGRLKFESLTLPLQMRRLFQDVGLTVEAVYGSSNGDSYERSSRRLIVVGRKGNGTG